MAINSSPWINLIVIYFYIYHGRPIQAKVHYRYMTNYCSKTILVDDSLVLTLTSQGNLPEDRTTDFVHCDLDLLAPTDMRLFAHFLQLGISPNVDHSDRLHLYDLGANNTRLSPVKGVYGKIDRTLSIFDNSGIQINDYKTTSNKMKVDYLGKPTRKSPGFRLLITNVQVPNYNNECPSRHFLCRHAWICIPRQTTCDGNPNCGKDDAGDEKGCDRYDTVTNLLAEYSLTRDIIVAILLPLVIFIGIVAIIFVMAKRYIKRKINKTELPAVHFTPKNEGQVRIEEEHEIYDPPAYEDILGLPKRYDPPPAYNGLTYSEDCSKSLDSDKAAWANNSGQIQTKPELEIEHKPKLDSISITNGTEEMLKSKLESSEYENYRLHCVWPSDTDDDEEIKTKRKRKGGKGKVKGKRTENRGNLEKVLTNRSESPVLSEESTPGKSSNSSVPVSDSISASITAESCSASTSSPDLPPTCDLSSSPSSCRQADLNHQDNHLTQRTSEDFIPIHITPSKSVYAPMPYFHEPPEDSLKSRKTSCNKTDSEIQTSARPTARECVKDINFQEVCSSKERYTSRGDRPNEDIMNVHNIPNQDRLADKYVANCTMNTDEDADVSSGSDSRSLVVNKHKVKMTLNTSDNSNSNVYTVVD